MSIALISDIHGNLHALEAVLRDIEDVGCDEVMCLGDLVGYGGDPEGCVRRIRESCSVVILGNHDAVAAGSLGDESFNEIARDAIRATREMLSEESRRYLAALPESHRIGDVYLTHAHPLPSESWSYVFPGERLDDIFRHNDAWLMVIGHTHTPGFGCDGFPVLGPFEPGSLTLNPDERCIVNVGSVGQPRDRDPRAAWARLDRESRTLELRRVEYDVAGAQQSIRDRGLPGFLADRLARGM
jgi:diadenosine tetraphosphatase ApaH/serine/threonine PP2A family protein phosphatase